MTFRKLALALMLPMALSLGACETLGPLTGPAPLAQTQVDEQGYKTALLAYEAFLDTVDALKAAGVLVPGTAKANSLADTIDTATAAFKTARKFQLAGNESNYAAAMIRASAALSDARTILQKRKTP